MSPIEIMDALVAWIMADPFKTGLVLGWLAGAFMMFSILTGYWIISDWIIRRIRRRW